MRPDGELETSSDGSHPAGSSPPRRVLGGSWIPRLEIVLPLLAYAVLSLLGVTTSSVGLLAVDQSVPVENQFGNGSHIRTDEWIKDTPNVLSVLATGAPQHSPLAQQPDLIYQISSGDLFESVLFAEGNMLRLGPWLPDTMLFAAFFNFPWLVLFLCLPALLRRMGASRPMSWFGTFLCWLAPASLWWSFFPIRILGFAAAGCLLLFLAHDRLARESRGRRDLSLAIVLAALAGVCLARLVTFYVPWSLTVGVPLVLATGVFLVADRTRRRTALTIIGIGAATALVVLVGTFWENWPALNAELNTEYPGQRLSTGAAQSPFQLFGAPGLGQLEDDPAPAITNQSEVTSAFLICGVWALLLWRSARRNASRAQWGAILTLAVATLVVSSWALFSWGSMGEHVPLLNRLLPSRAAQTIGYPATLLLALTLSRVESTAVRRALAVAAVCAGVTAYAVSDLQRALPHLGVGEVWAASLVTFGVVYALTRLPRSGIFVGLTAGLLLVAAVGSNPLLMGLGDIRSSPAANKARSFAAQSEADGTLWVADSHVISALLVANGVPSLSGYQITGPDTQAWEELDPDHAYESAWNRGASYLYFSFVLPEGAPPGRPVVTAPQNDGIQVSADPCWIADSSFEVRHLLALGTVDSPCAKQVGEFQWMNGMVRIYDLVPSAETETETGTGTGT